MTNFELLILAFLCVTWLGVGIVTGAWLYKSEHKIELKALQAQVDKKYCEGEVTYPELVEELRK